MIKKIFVDLLFRILPYISDSLRKLLSKFLRDLEDSANSTDNIVDNILVEILKALFQVEDQ